jgi:hypothetical protein
VSLKHQRHPVGVHIEASDAKHVRTTSQPACQSSFHATAPATAPPPRKLTTTKPRRRCVNMAQPGTKGMET